MWQSRRPCQRALNWNHSCQHILWSLTLVVAVTATVGRTVVVVVVVVVAINAAKIVSCVSPTGQKRKIRLRKQKPSHFNCAHEFYTSQIRSSPAWVPLTPAKEAVKLRSVAFSTFSKGFGVDEFRSESVNGGKNSMDGSGTLAIQYKQAKIVSSYQKFSRSSKLRSQWKKKWKVHYFCWNHSRKLRHSKPPKRSNKPKCGNASPVNNIAISQSELIK